MTSESITVKALTVTQPIGEFYVTAMNASDILRVCKFDFRRMQYTGTIVDFLGIQRRVDPGRARQIAAYSRTMDACFPGSVVLAIDERCAHVALTPLDGCVDITISSYLDSEDNHLNIALNESTSIIDGQHRLKGIEESGELEMMIPVTIFIGIDQATEASIFSTVNLAQTKVNKSLVYDLFSLQRRRSPERTCHDTVVSLDRMAESPLRGRIKRLGVATEGRRGETLSQATVVKGLLPYITSDALADRDRGRRFGFWEPVEGPENRRRIFRHFFVAGEDEKILATMVNYFAAIMRKWPESWQNTGDGNILNRTNGYLGFMRFLRPAYLSLTTSNEVPTHGDFAAILEMVDIKDGEFTTARFPPGSSGAKRLFEKLSIDTGLAA